MEDREQIIAKIRKLLALAENNPSAEESVSAALKAQALMASYSIEEDELAEEDEAPVAIESEIGQGRNWRFDLANAIAENFRCRTYRMEYSSQWQNSLTGRKSKRTSALNIVFFGYKTDAEAARLAYEHLYRVGNMLANREARHAREEYGYADGVYNTFCLGFVKGVRKELEVQAHALMIVVPPLVNDAYDAITFAGHAVNKSPRFGKHFAFDASAEGEVAGRDAVKAGRLNRGEEECLPAATA